MDDISDKLKASLSQSGVTFFNCSYNSDDYIGSSSLRYINDDFYPRSKQTTKTKLIKQKHRRNTAFRVNKSLVKSKALVFSSLPSSRRFLAFYSLSFPIGLDDLSAMKVLNIWLTRLRQTQPRVNYLWVAERQRNGTIHFHVLVDRYFNIRVVNYYMAKALDSLRNQFPTVFKNWNRRLYNGVDVKRVFNSRGVSNYIVKYITKQNATFHCRANGMSRLVSALFTKIVISAYEAMRYWDHLDFDCPNNPFAKRKILNDFATWIVWKHSLPGHFRKRLEVINKKVFMLCS